MFKVATIEVDENKNNIWKEKTSCKKGIMDVAYAKIKIKKIEFEIKPHPSQEKEK